MAEKIVRLENDTISVRLNDDFSARLLDKKSGTEWRMSPCCYQEIGALSDRAIWNRQERCYMDRYPSFFKARTLDNGALRVTVLDSLREPRGSFICHMHLDKQWLHFSIEDIDEQLPSLIFPPYIESESLVIPREIGQWRRKPISESLFIMPASGWCMRWFGGLNGNNGWIAIVDDGYADSGVYLSQLAACAGWQKSLGTWQGRKTLRIGFTSGGYVGLAKRFRSYAKSHGIFRSLKEKIADVPAVANLVGGRCISFFQAYTFHKEVRQFQMQPRNPGDDAREGNVQVLIPHRDVATIIDEAKKAGMNRGYFNLRGWLKGGYDESHPDVWPPEPLLGTAEELRTIMEQPDSFIGLLHDNYQDTYPQAPSFPRWVMRHPDGRLKAGGTWHGGRCYIINSTKSLQNVAHNWKNLSTLHFKGAFLDTISGAHFQEDFCPEHRMSRTEDSQSKLEIVRIYKERGLVVGSEIGSDFGMSLVDFIENRHRRIPGFSIPLWPLVYHDAVVTLRYKNGTDDFEAADDLEDMLWGYAKMWPAGNLENWRGHIDGFRRSLRVDEWHARIGLDEMVDHRYLDDEGTVEQTEFSSGLSIIANASDKPISAKGDKVAPGAWKIIE